MADGSLGPSRGTRPPRFEGEDTSPTTDQELKGWYSYGLAAEIFAVCGVGSFLPVTLEQLARERGVLRSDGVTSCIAPKTLDSEASAAPAIARLLRRATEGQDGSQCVVRPFGRDVSTSSFAMYTFSIAVLVQAIFLVSFSSMADYGTYRKKLLMGFGFAGSIACMLFIIVSPSIYLLGSALVVVGVTSLGCSFVLLNSFLPLLAANHPSVLHQADDTSGDVPLRPMGFDDSFDSRHNDFVSSESSSRTPVSPELALSTKISSKGVGIGYAAAVSVQVLSILLLFALSKVHFSSGSIPLRAVLLLVGFLWAVFTIPCTRWLRDRPGPPLSSSLGRKSRFRRIFAYVFFAWSSVWKIITVAIKLRQVVIFLIAWFLLSDAVATVSGTAILFARTELHMATVPIAILSITVTTCGIAGAFAWPKISSRYNLATHHTIIACTCLLQVVPMYGLIGYLPFIKAWGVGGLQMAWEIYPLGVVFGFVMGGLSSYCRSFYGQLIPPGSEAAFYALYAITDKGSSAVGPAIVGMIVDATGTIRPAFIFLAVLIALPVPLILLIDADKGRADAVRMAVAMSKNTRGGYERASIDDSDDEDAEGLLARDGHV